MKKLFETIWEKCEDNVDGAGAVALAILIILVAIVCVVALVCAGYGITAAIVMWLWNLVMPAIWLGAPRLTFWVALGVLVLCRLLFAKVITISKGSGD